MLLVGLLVMLLAALIGVGLFLRHVHLEMEKEIAEYKKSLDSAFLKRWG